jgi:transcriptional regulator with XRE-family HTH domain
MVPRIKSGSTELATAIRERRAALGLSIEEAAAKAGAGAKSWSRYESGGAIRHDKARGVCRALGWSKLPDTGVETDEVENDWLEQVDSSHEAWSSTLDELYGQTCATAFAVGSDLVYDHLVDDLQALAKEPRGTHLGQLPVSWLDGDLPAQFVPRYDYEFVYELKGAVKRLRRRFAHGELVAHTVLEELALYLVFGQTELLADLHPTFFDDDRDDWTEWLAGILGDLDIEFLLFTSDMVLTPDISYHFDHWSARQFHVDEGTETDEGALPH